MAYQENVHARTIYHNSTQRYHKDSATIFHSPFSCGKKNQGYTNPTFMSSSVFYNAQYASNAAVKQASIKPDRSRRNSDALLQDYATEKFEQVTVRKKSVPVIFSREVVDKKNVNQNNEELRKKMFSSVMKDIQNCLNRDLDQPQETKARLIEKRAQHEPVYFEKAADWAKIRADRHVDLIGQLKKQERKRKIVRYAKQRELTEDQKGMHTAIKARKEQLQRQANDKRELQSLYRQLLSAQSTVRKS